MIIEKCNSNVRQFQSIKVGDCFGFNEEIYIKTDASNFPRNAFSFTCNVVGYFKFDDLVTPLNAKVVIE